MFRGRNLQEDKNYCVISSPSREPVPVNVFSVTVSDLLLYPSDVPGQKSTRDKNYCVQRSASARQASGPSHMINIILAHLIRISVVP